MTLQTPIPIGNDPYATAYNSVGRERCENLYLERAGSETAKAQEFFIKIPGLRRFIASTSTNACRGLFTASSGRCFGVFGRDVFEILSNASKSLLFQIDTFTGPVQIAENRASDRDQEEIVLLFVDGANGYLFRLVDNTVEKIDPDTDGNEGFPNGATHVTCLDTYFLVNDPNTNRYGWSNPLYLGRTSAGLSGTGHWNGQNTNTKIAKPDNIVALTDCQNMLWLFGSNTIEVHYDAGASATATTGFAGVWQRYESAIIEVGCSARYSPAKFANNVFWIGADKTGTFGVFTNEGFLPKRISTRGIEQIMAQMPTVDDAVAFVFSEQGHSFYLIHFAEGDRTLVYDITTGTWHERTYLFREEGATHKWRGQYVCKAFGKLLFGDNSTDCIYQSDQQYYANDNPSGSGVNYIKCVKTTPIGFASGSLVRYKAVQPIFQHGVGLPQNTSEDVGLDPVALIAYSDDSGNSWSQEREVKLGKRGNYDTRSRLIQCGAARNRVWRITHTEPVPCILVGLMAELQPLGR